MSRVIDFHRRRATARFNARAEAERRKREWAWQFWPALIGTVLVVAMFIMAYSV